MQQSTHSEKTPRPLSPKSYEKRTYSHGPQNKKSNNAYLPQILWALSYFLTSFIRQITEFFSPLFLICGIGWEMIPHIFKFALASINKTSTTPDHTQDLIKNVTRTLPMELHVNGWVLTPHFLIFNAILLMLITAFCATLSTYLARHL